MSYEMKVTDSNLFHFFCVDMSKKKKKIVLDNYCLKNNFLVIKKIKKKINAKNLKCLSYYITLIIYTYIYIYMSA
jgi:hypothetical protein